MTDPQLPPPAPQAPGAPPAYGAPPPPVYPAPPRAYQPAPGGYAAPPGAYAAPPGAYQVPVGGYAAPSGAYQPPAPIETRPAVLGVVSLLLALVAAILTPIIAAPFAFQIGRRLPQGFVDATDPLMVFAPARDQFLWAEVSFWVGTALGIAAIVLGIVAISRRMGRGLGIGGLIIAMLGPFVFLTAVMTAFSFGTGAGFTDL